MHILDKIVAAKQKELRLKKSLISIAQLESSSLFNRPLNSMSERLKNSSSGIIAEHKRRSPSKPMINMSCSVEEVVKGYSEAGVCGISVLTNNQFFGGSLDDLLLARASVETPLLRKEFIIDEYQLIDAKAHGADVILLIAAILTPDRIKALASMAKSLNLEVLLEVHDREELEKSMGSDVSMIGVNNRNLKTFEVSVDTSRDLAPLIPEEYVRVSESGLEDAATIKDLRSHGYHGFLIGETFMRTNDPGTTAQNLIKQIEL